MNFIRKFNTYINKDDLSNPCATLFRNLTYKEKQSVEVYDFRNVSNEKPNNNVIITCEHASNKTHSYKFPNNQKKWLDTHWGYDIGSKDLGLELSEKANILSIYSNYSRLLIDPNRALTSNTLIRKYIEKNIELEINKDECVDEDKRIELFYLPYYRILKEVLNFIKPKYAICSHSFTKQYENNPERKFEVGILYREKGILADKIEFAYKKQGVNYRINEPYTPQEGVCHAMDSLYVYNWPEWYTDVVLLEFRNDYCEDPAWRKKQVEMLAPIIDSLKQ
jgi:predicted N-formylglutamate amidohydrolase